MICLVLVDFRCEIGGPEDLSVRRRFEMVLMERESRPRGRRPVAVAPREEAHVQTQMVASPHCRHVACGAGTEHRGGNSGQRDSLRENRGLCGFFRRLLIGGRQPPRGRRAGEVADSAGAGVETGNARAGMEEGSAIQDYQRELVCMIHGIPWRGTPFCTQTFDFPTRGCGVWGPPAPPPHPQRMPAEMHRLLGTLPRRREYELCAPGGCFFPPSDASPKGLEQGEKATPPPPPPKYDDELEDRFRWFYDRPPPSAFRREGWPPQPEPPQMPPYEPYLHYCLGNLPPRIADAEAEDSEESGDGAEGEDHGAGEGVAGRSERRVRASAGTTRMSTVAVSSRERARARRQSQSRSSAQLSTAAPASPAPCATLPASQPVQPPQSHSGRRRSARRTARRRAAVAAAAAAALPPGPRAYAMAMARTFSRAGDASGLGAVAASAMPQRPTAQLLKRVEHGLATAASADEVPPKSRTRRAMEPGTQRLTPAAAVAAAARVRSASRRHRRPAALVAPIRLGALAASPRKRAVTVDKKKGDSATEAGIVAGTQPLGCTMQSPKEADVARHHHRTPRPAPATPTAPTAADSPHHRRTPRAIQRSPDPFSEATPAAESVAQRHYAGEGPSRAKSKVSRRHRTPLAPADGASHVTRRRGDDAALQTTPLSRHMPGAAPSKPASGDYKQRFTDSIV